MGESTSNEKKSFDFENLPLELQWEFARLGAGYSIRSVHNGQYLTIETGMQDVVTNAFPVSWALELDTFEADVWRYVQAVRLS